MKVEYTHEEYRKARIIQIINKFGEEQYFYKSKEITKTEANQIVQHKNNEKSFQNIKINE